MKIAEARAQLRAKLQAWKIKFEQKVLSSFPVTWQIYLVEMRKFDPIIAVKFVYIETF